jgi:hypothetical protein
MTMGEGLPSELGFKLGEASIETSRRVGLGPNPKAPQDAKEIMSKLPIIARNIACVVSTVKLTSV